MNYGPNLTIAAAHAGKLVSELLNPFNKGKLTHHAVSHIQAILYALRIDTLTVRDIASDVVDQANDDY